MKVDILFLARNRREYTEEAFDQLYTNTNWNLVDSLCLFNDGGAGDVNAFFMTVALSWVKCKIHCKFPDIGSPVGCMNDFLSPDHFYRANDLPNDPTREHAAPWFAKIDNDTIVPPGWLDACVSVAETDNVDLIGIESRYCEHPPMGVTVVVGSTWTYPIIGYRSTDHVGGIGLFRRSVFTKYPLTGPPPAAVAHYTATGQDPRYYGFTEWQWSHPEVRKCWIDPPLPVFLLDHLDMEPWKSLGLEYERKGWQRRTWAYYHPEKDKALWEWWLNR